MNEPDHPDNGEDSARPEPSEPAEPSEDAATPPSEEPGADARSEDEVTSFYVRRGRAPTLGFWVVLALLAPAVAALLISPLFAFSDLSGVVNFMLLAAVFVGLPLAAIACVIDALRHRTPKRPRR